jgi:hypothetical protein
LQINPILARMGMAEDRAQFVIILITHAGWSPQRSPQTLMQTCTGYMVSPFSGNFVVFRDVE